MLSLTHSEDVSIMEILLKVQSASEFPIEIKIGNSRYKIQTEDQARFFSLGILAYVEAKENESNW